MEKKMTAVEWLMQSLFASFDLSYPYYKELFQQAKEMEKQQIEDAYKSGADFNFTISTGGAQHWSTYYNETYGS